jgi:hypothetical protein
MFTVSALVRASEIRSRALPPMLQNDARRGRDALRFSHVERGERPLIFRFGNNLESKTPLCFDSDRLACSEVFRNKNTVT